MIEKIVTCKTVCSLLGKDEERLFALERNRREQMASKCKEIEGVLYTFKNGVYLSIRKDSGRYFLIADGKNAQDRMKDILSRCKN